MVESPEKALMQMKEHPSPHSDVQLQGETAGFHSYKSSCIRLWLKLYTCIKKFDLTHVDLLVLSHRNDKSSALFGEKMRRFFLCAGTLSQLKAVAVFLWLNHSCHGCRQSNWYHLLPFCDSKCLIATFTTIGQWKLKVWIVQEVVLEATVSILFFGSWSPSCCGCLCMPVCVF